MWKALRKADNRFFSSSSSHPIVRVSPEVSELKKQRRGKSAPLSSASTEMSRQIMDKVQPDGGAETAADPLEPWSTKDIKSINNILDSSDRE